ncbi:MAG TPA: zinc ribbon domain-containing protein [Bryobacteraceae bacterium]|nr:zinc ribbon domain-containing protein [Bryobacteraceae bacterium]
MSTHCTCGAELPPDARFCHKCGKPQYESSFEEEPPAAEVQPVAAPEVAEIRPLEINFRNPAAVRTALITALITSVLSSLPIPPQGVWLLISLLMAGFMAVFLYIRRTGQSLSVVSGARMGWITGIFSFAIATIFFTLSVLLITNRGGFSTFYREQLQGRMARDADVEKFLELLQNPAGLGTVLFLTLGLLFVLFTIFPTLGGALGAKVFARDRV